MIALLISLTADAILACLVFVFWLSYRRVVKENEILREALNKLPTVEVGKKRLTMWD